MKNETHPPESLKVGDICDAIGISGAPRHGRFIEHEGEHSVIDCEGRRLCVRRDSLRKSLPAPVEMYGEQPSELPATLPAGTRCVYRAGVDSYVALSSAALVRRDNGDHDYFARWRGEQTGREYQSNVLARLIVWSEVPKSPSPQPERGEEIPGDVAELLAEARKYRPECVVEKRADGLVLYRSEGPGYVKNSWAVFDWNDFKTQTRIGAVPRESLKVALAESRVWPRADAERLARGEQPVPAVAGDATPEAASDREPGKRDDAGTAQTRPPGPSQPSAGRGVWGIVREREPMVVRHVGKDPYEPYRALNDADVSVLMAKRDSARLASRARTEKAEETHPVAWPEGSWDDVNEPTVF